jgi:DNA-binding transcriptional MerR regulator
VSQYSIRDLEHLSGIKAHTLRIWESRYGILAPKRTTTNIRFYDSDDLKRVLNISVLNDHGYRISRIARMLPEELHEEVIKLSRDFSHYPDQINSLTLSMIDLDESRFDRVINTNMQRIGVEKTLLEVVYPFLIRIGVLWQTGAITPAQEHFISNLVRQKLIAAIDSQSHVYTSRTRKFILFLPEGELHELGLLFANWIVKSRNHRAYYLGQSLPLSDLISVCDTVKPDYIFSIFTNSPTEEEIRTYISALTGIFKPHQLLFTGSGLTEFKGSELATFHHLDIASDLIGFLDALKQA